MLKIASAIGPGEEDTRVQKIGGWLPSLLHVFHSSLILLLSILLLDGPVEFVRSSDTKCGSQYISLADSEGVDVHDFVSALCKIGLTM